MSRTVRKLLMLALVASSAAQASGFADYRAAMGAVDRGDLDAAIRLFGQALHEGLRPAMQQEAYYNRGVLYHRQGRYDLAIADYTSALKLKPDDARALNNRGVAYKNQHRYDLALADYNTAIRLRPDDPSAYLNRGNVYEQQGQAERAIADFNDAIRLRAGAAPDSANIFDESKFAAGTPKLGPSQQPAAAEDRQYLLIWRYLAERRNGEDGRQELALGAGKLRSRGWPYPVISFFLGKLGRAEVLAAAQDSGADAPGRHGCEAAAFLGEDDLLRGNTDSALHLFAQALDQCPADSAERNLVLAERTRGTAQH